MVRLWAYIKFMMMIRVSYCCNIIICGIAGQNQPTGAKFPMEIIKVVSSEFYFHKPITVHIELYLFYRFIHLLLYIGQY